MVNVGGRTLPTNPSARDRRALQTTVADKISARMVKTQKNGLRTIPPRRRCSDGDGEFTTSSTSSSTSTPTKSGAWSNSHSGMITPHHTANTTMHHHHHQQHQNHHNHSGGAATASRKRPSNSGHTQQQTKKHRGKKHNTKNSMQHRRNISDSDEAENQEKRNLHNDMERQRRIGLKNLFEELKATIPSIKDKERAPKVNILREASILCTKLTREHEQYQALKKQNTRLLARLKILKASVANSSRSRYVD